MKITNELISPPKTIMEVYKMLPEGTRAELIDGNLNMPPPPNLQHQETSGDLHFEIRKYLEATNLGKVYAAPVAVYLDEHSNAVEPDLVFVLQENKEILKPDGIHGSPDLIIEILSPGNKDNDTVRKKQLYERFGVKEYWIVEPKIKEVIGYALTENKYEEIFMGTGKIQSRLLNHTFEF